MCIKKIKACNDMGNITDEDEDNHPQWELPEII